MKRKLLFAWELGAGTGHVSPYLPLLRRMQARGWEITAAVRDTMEVGDMLRPLGITMVQAPVCARQFNGFDSLSYNFTETLLHFGYGDTRALHGLVEAWVSLCDLIGPDLIICSAAPALQLVAQNRGLPHTIIGSGYNCPPPAHPLPLIRDWAPGVEQRLQNAEATVGSVLASVREKVFLEPGAYTTQQLFANSPAQLCTFRELDHYPARSADSAYFGILTARRYPAVRTSEYEVFAYLRNCAQGEALVSALAQSKLRALVYWPDAPNRNHFRHESGHLKITDRAVQLEHVLGGCRFVVGYGSHHLTAEALLAGKPLMLLPNYLEQELTCRAVEHLGAGISTVGKGRKMRFNRLIAQMCEDTSLQSAAQRFAANQDNWSAEESAESLAEKCEQLISSHLAAPRKVVAL